jgi:hypothetical protein
MACLVWNSHQDAAGHSSGGRNHLQDRLLPLEGDQAEGLLTGGRLDCPPGSTEREPKVSLGDDRQQGGPWEPRDGSRRHAVEILPHEIVRSQTDPDLYLLPGPFLMRLRVRFLVQFLFRA